MEQQTAEKNPVQSAQRIFEILELLAKEGKMALTDISQVLQLHKSTVHRLLCSLSAMGYAKKDDSTGKYTLTYKLLELSGCMLDGIDIVSTARPYLERLGEQTQEAVHLVARDGGEIVYVDKVEPGAGTIRMVSRIGLRRPMYCTGVGKAMMAYMGRGEVREIWEGSSVQALTEHTIVSLPALYEELERIRSAGYALDNEENELGVRCIAVCIQGHQGRAEYALSISAPILRMCDARIGQLAPLILSVRQDLSRELGYREKNAALPARG